MGKMKDMLLEMQETPFMDPCPECGGDGEVEYEVPRPHAFGPNEGYIDTEYETCSECGGDGEIERRCVECDAPVCKARTDDRGSIIINPIDFDLCEECAV